MAESKIDRRPAGKGTTKTDVRIWDEDGRPRVVPSIVAREILKQGVYTRDPEEGARRRKKGGNETPAERSVEEVSGVGRGLAKKLAAAGLDTPEAIEAATIEQLTGVPGISEELAADLKAWAKG